MTDENCVQWVVPAITLGYSVVNDPDGKFKFFTDEVEIVHRCHDWIAIDGIDPNRHYTDLLSALTSEI